MGRHNQSERRLVTRIEDNADDLMGPVLPAHLYVHVPFCSSKCAYCDFASESGASDETVSAVFQGIRSQLRRWSEPGPGGVVETIYVGGGTPSLYPKEVAGILEQARRLFTVRDGAEVTVEANPDSLTRDAVGILSEAGASRVSVGVQSFDDGVLRVLGRRHDAAAAASACRTVLEAGLELSIDLICGVPGQGMTSWAETLARAASSGARHVSVYPLSLEDGTPLQVAVDTGLVSQPDADEAADMMLLAEETLGRAGLMRYEVASYATDREHESRHNTAYWTRCSYIGVGPGAHGMLDAATARVLGLVGPSDEDTARVRYSNSRDIEDWLLGRGDQSEMLTSDEVVREDVMLGMRLVRGVAWSTVQSAGLTEVLESLAADGLVELVSDGVSRPGPNWRTTQRGWLLGNRVFSRIWNGA